MKNQQVGSLHLKNRHRSPLILRQLLGTGSWFTFEQNPQRSRMGQNSHSRCKIQFFAGCRRLWKTSNRGRSTSLPRRIRPNVSATLWRVSSGSKGSQAYGCYVNRGNCTLIGREAVNHSTELLHWNHPRP